MLPAKCFKKATLDNIDQYKDGLTILRSPQCPYTEKNVNAIMDSARKKFKLEPRLVEFNTPVMVQGAPSPFGTFCIIYNGEVITHHPISNTRFENIMNKYFSNN